MKIIVSMEKPKKIKIGEFDNPEYAAMFVQGVVQTGLLNKEYVKLVVEVAEED